MEVMCNIINGRSDCSFSQGVKFLPREDCLSYDLGQCGKEESTAPMFAKGLEEGVITDSNVSEEYILPFPIVSLFILGLTCCAFFTDSFLSTVQSHESISNIKGI